VWPHVPITGCTAAVPPCIIRVNPDGRWCAHPFKCDRMVRKRLLKDVAMLPWLIRPITRRIAGRTGGCPRSSCASAHGPCACRDSGIACGCAN
jgi:hypothetical protein